jgi:hypothetical protein
LAALSGYSNRESNTRLEVKAVQQIADFESGGKLFPDWSAPWTDWNGGSVFDQLNTFKANEFRYDFFGNVLGQNPGPAQPDEQTQTSVLQPNTAVQPGPFQPPTNDGAQTQTPATPSTQQPATQPAQSAALHDFVQQYGVIILIGLAIWAVSKS